jgi:AraC-like DNA-binding protein
MLTLPAKDEFCPDSFPIIVDRCNPQNGLDLSAPDFSKIVIILGGHALRASGRVSWPVTTGDVFVVPRQERRAYLEAKDLRLINILFCHEKLPMELLDLPGVPGYQALFTFASSEDKTRARECEFHLSPRELGVVCSYAETLADELEMRSPGFAFMAYSWFMQLVGYLSRVYCKSKRPDRRARLSVSNAIEHLEMHFDEPVNLDQLSHLTHLSKRTFSRTFLAATGLTPMAYLANLRLTRAAAMLRRQEENVTSVALKVGFNDSNYFARRFHAMFGLSPSEYRKRQEML